MKNSKIGAGLIILLVIIIITGISCTNHQIPGKESGAITANSCEGCHTDYERLIEVHSPDTEPPAGG